MLRGRTLIAKRKEKNKAEDLKFYSSALDLLLEQMPIALLAVIVNSTLYFWLSWRLQKPEFLVVWYLLIVFITAIRFRFYRKWVRAKNRLDKPTILKLLKRIQFGVGTSAALWGAAGAGLLVLDSTWHFALTVFIFAGMSAGALSAYSISLSTTLWSLYPMMLPLILRLFLEGKDYAPMGIMATLFLFLMTTIAKNLNRRSLHMLRLGLENRSLVSKISDASHEIKTPATAILGIAELLKAQKDLPKDAREFSERIYRNGLYLKNLVENILLLSKSESHQLEPKKELVGIKQEVATVTSLMEPRLKEKNLDFQLSYSARVPNQIFTNTLYFKQILINLISNAVKFTPAKGSIKLEIDFLPSQMLIVQISDSGIGIGVEGQKKLFEPFYRENRPQVKTQEGSGLGLALSKSLAQNLGGNLSLVKSELGRGSTFEVSMKVEVPTSPIQLDNEDDNEILNFSGSKVMIVDDSEDILFLFREQLLLLGATVDVCPDGESAVSRISEGSHYDLILMDINMPGMDGYQATTRIRDMGYKQPILALSAYDAATTSDLCRESGFNEYIGKTSGLKEISDVLQRWLN